MGWIACLGFEAEDDNLVRAYCRISNFGEQRHWGSTGQLSYELIETDIGTAGIHDSLIVFLSKATCVQARDVWYENAMDRGRNKEDTSISTSPIADLIGVDPPADLDDWYHDCQYEQPTN